MEKVTLTCQCRQSQFTLEGAPIVALHCHCEACREVTLMPFYSACAFKPENLTRHTPEEIERFRPSHLNMARYFCRRCGMLLYLINRLDLITIPLIHFDRDFRRQFPPKCHLFYAERVLDIPDTLPKYLKGIP